ncbi:MAG: hypothetical protein M3511_13690 [Deinococcota bacterium]|nr:hypothetical protein [Deinococcota bacterium]
MLMRAHELATLLPYRQTSEVLKRWGVDLGKSLLCNLNEKLNQATQAQGSRKLSELAQEPLFSRSYSGKTWIIEVDGKFVPVWTEEQEKKLEWREVKTAVLYPRRAPSERYYVSHLGSHEPFSQCVHGLLRHAGVKQEDRLIGLSDGALWIASLMGDLGVHRHILDVYHASTYFETLLLGLAWSEPERERERRALLRGEIDVQTWLNQHVPVGTVLNEEARAALLYLNKQALLEHTCYPRFRAEGLEVIGSGQIEGANKSVIGGRLNISGAHWSEEGAQGMVFVRAQYHSHRALTDFHDVRRRAFPKAA